MNFYYYIGEVDGETKILGQGYTLALAIEAGKAKAISEMACNPRVISMFDGKAYHQQIKD